MTWGFECFGICGLACFGVALGGLECFGVLWFFGSLGFLWACVCVVWVRRWVCLVTGFCFWGVFGILRFGFFWALCSAVFGLDSWMWGLSCLFVELWFGGLCDFALEFIVFWVFPSLGGFDVWFGCYLLCLGFF